MQREIDTYNSELQGVNPGVSSAEGGRTSTLNSGDTIHARLGSQSKQLTLSLLEDSYRGDPAFHALENRVRQFIVLNAPGFRLIPGHPIKVTTYFLWLTYLLIFN